MMQEVVHIGETNSIDFQEKINKETESRNNSGWKLEDIEFSTALDSETGDIVFDALLTFER